MADISMPFEAVENRDMAERLLSSLPRNSRKPYCSGTGCHPGHHRLGVLRCGPAPVRDSSSGASTQQGGCHDLLTTKLFCGKCGSMMAGESGRSHTGAVRCYYKCDTRKRGGKEACSLKSERKEPLEQFVVQTALEKVLNDRFIDLLADKLLEYQSKENTHLPVLQAELKEVERRIDNLVAVIEQGILTPSTKTRISSKKWSSGSNAGAFGWSAFRLTMALSLPTVSPTAKKTCQLFLSKRLHASGFATN